MNTNILLKIIIILLLILFSLIGYSINDKVTKIYAFLSGYDSVSEENY